MTNVYLVVDQLQRMYAGFFSMMIGSDILLLMIYFAVISKKDKS